MKRTALALAMGLLAMAFGTGCKVTAISVTGAATYESCVTTSDCGSTLDLCVEIPGTTDTLAACTYECSDDIDCEAGGRCLSFDGGDRFFCVQSCGLAGTRDVCEIGWECNTIDAGRNVCLPGTAPLPTINPYDECTYGADPDLCGEGTGCWGVTVDTASSAFCSDTCTVDADCPLDRSGFAGVCLEFPGQPALCWEGCTDTLDCAPGWACKSMASGLTFPMICVPTN